MTKRSLGRTLLIVFLSAGMLVILVLMAKWVQFVLFRTTPPPTEHYLKEEEAVVIESKNEEEAVEVIPIKDPLFEYIEVIDGCGPHFEGSCLNARSGPGEDYPVVARLRSSIILKVAGMVERDNRTWYKIEFHEWLRYPERVEGDWYVAADYVRVLLDGGDRNINDHTGTSTKRIIVDRSEQMLYAYDGDELFMETSISTGVELTPTPRGTFIIFKKTPSRYMQGPIPGITDTYYDLPGVPWNLYFTHQGAVIHGTYWHNNFGRPSSNGCVNLAPQQAQKLYAWADIGMRVIVRD